MCLSANIAANLLCTPFNLPHTGRTTHILRRNKKQHPFVRLHFAAEVANVCVCVHAAATQASVRKSNDYAARRRCQGETRATLTNPTRPPDDTQTHTHTHTILAKKWELSCGRHVLYYSSHLKYVHHDILSNTFTI